MPEADLLGPPTVIRSTIHPEEPAVASTLAVTIGVSTPDPMNSARGVKRSSAGAEGAVVEAISDFEGSMEELHQWLL